MRVTGGSVGLAAAVLLLGSAPTSRGDDKPRNVIPAAEAKDHVGERCTVETTVKASKYSVHRKCYFLDSEADFRDAKNFTAVIAQDDAAKFQRAGIDDPAEHYRGKTLRVTGKVIAEDDQVRIRVTDPGQIQLVESAKP
jgi:hypothetical protein